MHWLTWTFLLAIGAGLALRLWLAQRQIMHVRSHRDRIPRPFDSAIDLAAHRKAADYTVDRVRLARLSGLIDALVLLGLTLGGGLQWLAQQWQSAGFGPVLTGAGFLLSLQIALSLIGIPLSLYRTFVLEERYGFNRMTIGLFLADLGKGLLLLLALGTPLIATVLWLMDRAGAQWWLYAWVVWAAFTALLTWAYPRFIAPLFNTFRPLENVELRRRVEALVQRCGFRSEGVSVMDGSRRSAHGNAYFTGIGNHKRIVFFDTLIEALEPAEVEAVLAHELGHFRKHHVRNRLLLGYAFGLAGLAALGWLKLQPWFYDALGVELISDYTALALFVIVVPVYTFFLTPIATYLSRRHEFEADEYAAVHADAQALISGLIKLYRDNASTLTPDPIHSGFYDSHPPAALRVARLNQLGHAQS